MLHQLDSPGPAVAALAADRLAGFVFRNFCNLVHDNGEKAIVLADSCTDPRILVAHYHGSAMVIGDESLYRPVWDDILNLRINQSINWPEEHVEVAEYRGLERRGLFCNSTPHTFWLAAGDAGMTLNEEGESLAWLWVLEGGPQLSRFVKHPCRQATGEELAELLVQGIHYDKEGHYVRQCLKHGPSFVCEIDGEPVCWSATHLSGTPGMIYTPDEHRRKGYAQSLGAFHIDHVLERNGFACFHIIGGNTASEEMCKNFGFKRYGKPLVWRSVYWPL